MSLDIQDYVVGFPTTKKVAAAIRQNPRLFQRLSTKWRKNEECCKTAFAIDGMLLEHCPPVVVANRDLVMRAIRNNGRAIQFAERIAGEG